MSKKDTLCIINMKSKYCWSTLYFGTCECIDLYMWSFTEEAISTLSGRPLIFVDQFIYFGSNITSTESDVNIILAKAWNAINRLSIIWKSNQFDKIKWDFCWAAAVSILLYGCTTWMITKGIEKKQDRNKARMLSAVKSLKQYPTKEQLYGNLPPISKTIQVRWTRYNRHC